MIGGWLLVSMALTFPGAADEGTNWVPYTSHEGNFVVDFPGKPTRTFARQAQSREGMVRVVVVQCDTPDVLYTAEKVEVSRPANLKPAEINALLDSWQQDLETEFNGRVVAQKRLRLDSGAYGKDFTIEGRPDPKAGLATIRVREYLAQKLLYILVASSAADRDLPDDVGHFFASFSPGTRRTRRVGPHPEPAGRPLGAWGLAIDPDRDCRIVDRGDALEIAIPGTHHDLNADNDKLNSPRVVREVTGDFTVTVKVTGDFRPGDRSTNPKAVPYIGGGIVVWQDSNNYVFLGRAGINREGKLGEYAAFEEREWGARGAMNNRGIEPGGVYLRLERRNNRLLGYTSRDGRTWSKLDPMEPSYPATLKVGLYAINGCTDPVTVRFEEFQFTPGKASAPSRARPNTKAKTKAKGRRT